LNIPDQPASAAEAALTADSNATAVEAGSRAEEKATSLWGYPATYLLVGLNVAVFVAMLVYGSGPLIDAWRRHDWQQLLTAGFDAQTLTRFGSSGPALVLRNGQWWRLLTSMFVHVTVLHIALNMWCLWNLGLFGEPLLGRRGLVAVYVLTGGAGMVASLGWNVFTRQYGQIVAGASGAVFGIAGILIILLSNRKLSLPWEELRHLRRQVIFFAVANLAIGMGSNLLGGLARGASRVDNSAHLGGFVCGLALGLPLFPRMTTGRTSYRARQRETFAVAALVLSLLGYAIAQFA
jgi:rhomboid protease GluP